MLDDKCAEVSEFFWVVAIYPLVCFVNISNIIRTFFLSHILGRDGLIDVVLLLNLCTIPQPQTFIYPVPQPSLIERHLLDDLFST